jgi:type III restriction enzyme
VSGGALDKDFREMAADEIERFRRDILERGGRDANDLRAGGEIDDATLLREVMNTVGKKGRLGEQVRCVVSVSMLTEGWDANTVTHILGVRAFGTQLLCEQVVGGDLPRQSYDVDPDTGLFSVEYADVLGIPFDFAAKPVVVKPAPPRETVRVHAVKPDGDALEIVFPRVEGYRVELPAERLEATFGPDHVLHLTPELVGPSVTKNQGIIGEASISRSRIWKTRALRPSCSTSPGTFSTTNIAIPARSRSCTCSASSSGSRGNGSKAAG